MPKGAAGVETNNLFNGGEEFTPTSTDGCQRTPQDSIDGTHNIWIVKPSRSARGNGIMLHS